MWNHVCYDDWNDIATSLVCRTLGFGSQGTVSHTNPNNALLRYKVQCNGNETQFVQCIDYSRSRSDCNFGSRVFCSLQGRKGLRGYPNSIHHFSSFNVKSKQMLVKQYIRTQKVEFWRLFYLKVTVAMETAAILEIWRNYDFSFFWLTKRAIFKIPNQCYYLYIILWSDRRKLLFKSHKAQFGRIFDHKISIFGKK